MKLCANQVVPILVMFHLAPVLGAPNIGTGLLNKLGGLPNDPKLKTAKATAGKAVAAAKPKGAHVLGEAHHLLDQTKGKLDQAGHFAHDEFAHLGKIIQGCAPRDCKQRYHLKEAMRWIRQALADVGVFINKHPLATAAFVIGVTVLMADLISADVALEVIGFGAKGPIKNTIAAAIQSRIGLVEAGSIFARLQSAAMGGTGIREILRMATIGFTAGGLLAAGTWKLLDEDRLSLGHSTSFEPKEWRAWEAESRADFAQEEVSQAARFWESPTPEGCIAYGYREYRAPIWYVPEGMDPMTACAQTPAAIEGLGFKTPLGCLDEGPKKGVVGTWYVHTNGTDCMPNWSTFEDEGCMRYGHRRKFARLHGLGLQDDWTGVCESTPALVDGTYYNGPSYCEDKGILGIYGIFDVVDQHCECSCIHI